jgi:hypothetical protein
LGATALEHSARIADTSVQVLIDHHAMRNHWILFPLLVQMVLALEAYVALGVRRFRAGKSGDIDLKKSKLDASVWPDAVRSVNNNLQNQFESPVLFYTLVVVLWQMQAASAWAQAFAWLYVLSRILHTYVHTGRNQVRWRFLLFMFSLVMIASLGVLVGWNAFGPVEPI